MWRLQRARCGDCSGREGCLTLERFCSTSSRAEPSKLDTCLLLLLNAGVGFSAFSSMGAKVPYAADLLPHTPQPSAQPPIRHASPALPCDTVRAASVTQLQIAAARRSSKREMDAWVDAGGMLHLAASHDRVGRPRATDRPYCWLAATSSRPGAGAFETFWWRTPWTHVGSKAIMWANEGLGH